MSPRHPLPQIWLMTDERIADLPGSIARLPKGSGIVFRHYSLNSRERRALFEQVRVLARRSRHFLLLADTPGCARAWGADGAHDRSRLRSQGLRSASAHDLVELNAATRAKADLIFVSPVFSTRSHPGSRTLGRLGLAAIASRSQVRIIALGGMNARKAKILTKSRIHGWAAIDAFVQF
jgi:thiamine-phosphate pyrophosphorylase